ncbi:class I SAM-dependent methyltransferase [Arthrobacter ginkgonis]|uniref:Class I SAM-dependent methyltransferase n=1 Tax=Arthrobacter ginkgonis TaxID=1630594 RepID=A0ABP7DCA5_9MICC
MRRAVDAVEEMDRPDCDPLLLERTYAQFPLVNGAFSRWHGIYRDLLRPVLLDAAGSGVQRGGRTATVLDIGSGGGDIALALAGWAARDGIAVQVTGIDPDERAHAFATRAAAKAAARADAAASRTRTPGSAAPGGPGVVFRRAHSADLVAEGSRFDVVLSNHVLHHLGQAELVGLLADSQALAGGIAVHADIRRSRTALLLFGAATLPLAGRSFIRRDGLASIRRSYTGPELAALAPPGWEVRSRRPFRNLLIHRPRMTGPPENPGNPGNPGSPRTPGGPGGPGAAP